MKAYLAFFITAIGLSTSCVMASTVNTQLGTADSPYIINVTQRYDERLINTEKLPGKAHLKLTHIAPSERHLYAIKISYEKAKNDVLLGPSELALPAQQKQQVQNAEGAATVNCLDELNQYGNTLSEVGEDNMMALMNLINSVDVSGNVQCKKIKDALIASTQIERTADIRLGTHLTIKVTKLVNGTEMTIASIVMREDVSQWVLHTGWTFIRNKDKDYFSSKNEDGTYSIKQQGGSSSWNHALTAMYTYSTWDLSKLGDGMKAGPTGMLGISKNSVLVGVGLSLVIADNLTLTYGYMLTEFDRLNGTYEVGQNIGTTALDSSALSQKKIMGSHGLTIGFRFK